MRIALVSDAWTPQVNGVVRTLGNTVEILRAGGHEVETITPDRFRTIACPSYPEIRLALGARTGVARLLGGFAPEAAHIATEGPLGWAARRWCRRAGMPFTTSFHTRFPDYIALRTRLPADWFWPAVRRFHAPATRVFAATETLTRELSARGLPQTHRWSRGVDLTLFSPDAPPLPAIAGLPRPIQLYVGRVAVEKNVEAFLRTSVPGSKVVVGDGPARAELEQRFPQVTFTGALHGAALASAYASSDVFVFPSRTDTFGLVLLEALASGVPVAALPVPGPRDVIGGNAQVGALNEELDVAIAEALRLDRADCIAFARRHSWDACTSDFLAGLAPKPPLTPPS